jgi:hypothetical protein
VLGYRTCTLDLVSVRNMKRKLGSSYTGISLLTAMSVYLRLDGELADIPVQKPSSSKILIPLVHHQLGILTLHLLAEHDSHHQSRVASTHADNTDGSSCADRFFVDGVGWVQGGSRIYRVAGLSEQCVARQHVVTTLCLVGA